MYWEGQDQVQQHMLGTVTSDASKMTVQCTRINLDQFHVILILFTPYRQDLKDSTISGGAHSKYQRNSPICFLSGTGFPAKSFRLSHEMRKRCLLHISRNRLYAIHVSALKSLELKPSSAMPQNWAEHPDLAKGIGDS